MQILPATFCNCPKGWFPCFFFSSPCTVRIVNVKISSQILHRGAKSSTFRLSLTQCRFATSGSHQALGLGQEKSYISGFCLAFETNFTSGENTSIKCLFPLGRDRCEPCIPPNTGTRMFATLGSAAHWRAPQLPCECLVAELLRNGVANISGQALYFGGTQNGTLVCNCCYTQGCVRLIHMPTRQVIRSECGGVSICD